MNKRELILNQRIENCRENEASTEDKIYRKYLFKTSEYALKLLIPIIALSKVFTFNQVEIFTFT